jgi:glycosyltransferase involved in cell wall biosynthesis
LIIPGGIGTGKDNIGVPVLERIVMLLSNDFSVTVFQLFPRNRNYSPVGFELVDVNSTFLPIRLLKLCIVFFRHNRKSRFKAVHGFWALPGGLLAVLMGKFFGIKSMVSILGGDTISLPEIDYGQLQSFFYRKIVFWTLREADEVIALTRYLEKNLEAFGFRKTNIHIVPWGIDTRLFSYIEKPLENKVRFLHVGNLHPVKDQRTLLKAFKIVSDEIDAMLTIIGEGILADEIESVVGDLALYDKVKFINQQPYETLPSYYHAADVLLHTSLSEGQCEVVTEAMSFQGFGSPLPTT